MLWKGLTANQSWSTDILIMDTGSDLNVYLDAMAGGCCSAMGSMASDLKGEDLNQWSGK